jgi:hypothetical protein
MTITQNRYIANFLTYLLISSFAILTFVLPKLLENKILIYDVLIAEDGFFINCYNSKTVLQCFFEGYRGWLHTPSMAISAVIYQFPIQNWAILNFLIHMILLAIFAGLIYFSLIQLIKSRTESILLTLIVLSNPMLQIESIHQVAALYTYMVIPLIVSVLRVNTKTSNFWIALILVPLSVTWQFDTFFLATIALIISVKHFGISKRIVSLIVIYAFTFVVVVVSINLDEASSRIMNFRISMVTDTINSILTLVPMLGLGKDWPYMSTPNQTFDSNYISIVTSFTFIMICFLLVKYRTRVYLSISKSTQIIRDIVIITLAYQLCVIFFLQGAARNIAVFQSLLTPLIYLSLKQNRKINVRYISLVLLIYSMLSLNHVEKLKPHMSWVDQVKASQLLCQQQNNELNVTFFLPHPTLASMDIHCDDLNFNR